MRAFLGTHWKSIVALVILILLAVLTMSPGSAGIDLAARLRQHVTAITPGEQEADSPDALEHAARYIETTLTRSGYRVQKQEYSAGSGAVRNIEVSLTSVPDGQQPTRIFIIGARFDAAQIVEGADHNASGTAAVLELARLLRHMHPGPGTELKFIFSINEEPPGNFIAFAGTRTSSALVAQALAAFRADAGFPAHGLATPAYVQGVTLYDHGAYNHPAYPALMITDTAFLRYPFYSTSDDIPDKLDSKGLARVVEGLSQTIAALAGTVGA